jgi:hypothetical protein
MTIILKVNKMEMKGHNITEYGNYTIISRTAGLVLIDEIEEILIDINILPMKKEELISEKVHNTNTEILFEAFSLYKGHFQSDNPDITNREREVTELMMMAIESVIQYRVGDD